MTKTNAARRPTKRDAVAARERVKGTPIGRLQIASESALIADGYAIPRNDTRGRFLPKPRGVISASLMSQAALADISPESPRPREMLETVTMTGDDALTAQDIALHELLVACAYEQMYERAVAGEPTTIECEISLREICTFLGPSVRRQHVRKSLRALRRTEVTYGDPGGRYFEDVPLLVGWTQGDASRDVVRYVLPSPIAYLMASPTRYAYLELAAIAGMGTRYGVRLYRQLALRMAKQKWDPYADPTTIELAPAEMADWLGYRETPLHVGHLKTVLDRAVCDLSSVRRFAVRLGEPVREAKRGAPIGAFRIIVELREPARTVAHVSPTVRNYGVTRVGGSDAPQYRVSSWTWRRISTMVESNPLALYNRRYQEAWFLALDEALCGKRLTSDHKRFYRGQGLLVAIDCLGADEAAWRWAIEEYGNPDLIEHRSECHGTVFAAQLRDAERARYHRFRDHVEPSRRRRSTKADSAPRTNEEYEDRAVARDAARLDAFACCNRVIIDLDRERLERYGANPWKKVAEAIRKHSGYEGKRVVDVVNDRGDFLLRYAVTLDSLRYVDWTALQSPHSPPAEAAVHPVVGDRAIPALGIEECIGRTAARGSAAKAITATAPRILHVEHREADDDDLRMGGDFGDIDEPDFDDFPVGGDDHDHEIAF